MRVLGLDVGVASVGWAILEFVGGVWTIIATGVRTFNSPVVGGTGDDKFESLAADKRRFCGTMRQHRRKAGKMNKLRHMLHDAALLPDAGKEALAKAQARVSPKGQKPQITPYALRAEGLLRLLTTDEFAVVLGHFVAHCGFKPAMGRKGKNEEEEKNKILAASRSMRSYAQEGYETIGQKIAKDEKFLTRKRNKANDYGHTVTRTELHDEIRILFNRQREAGMALATDKLHDKITQLMDHTEDPPFEYYPVGKYRLEGEDRAAKRSPSFELFRLLTSLIHRRIVINGAEHRPNRQQIDAAVELAREQGKLSFRNLRSLWSLSADASFKKIDRARESEDIAERNGGAMLGTRRLREILSGCLDEPVASPEVQDKIAWIVSFATSARVVERDLKKLELPALAVETLMQAWNGGQLNEFTKSGNLSVEACRKLIARLPDASDLKECEKLLYGNALTVRPAEPVRNPVTRRIVKECREQVEAIIREYGMSQPLDRIHVEFARDVARGTKARTEIEDAMNKLNAKKKKELKQFKDKLGCEPTGNQLLMFSLCEEQQFKCFYTGQCIEPQWITSADNQLEIDHILPRWRSGMMQDRNNLILCLTGANREKRDLTPYEWFHGPRRQSDWTWEQFEALAKGTKTLPPKKRHFLLMADASYLKKGFRKRSLVDTQYAARLIPDELRRHLTSTFAENLPMPKIIARPAKLVSWMRHSWGIDGLKNPNGKRTSDDRHHAVDAIVVAAITDRILVRAIAAAKQNEQSGRPRFQVHIDPPWRTFRSDTEATRDAIFVSRATNTDFSGRLHKDTTYALTDVSVPAKPAKKKTGPAQESQPVSRRVKVVKKAVNDLTLKDLENIKDRDRNHRLVKLLEDWLALPEKERKNSPPTWKYGLRDGKEHREPIREVSLVTNENPAFTPKRVIDKETGKPFASFNRGEMARVDVFRKSNKKGKYEYFLVPIYPHEIATLDAPPLRAVQGGGDEDKWPQIDSTFEFLWSMNQMTLLEITKTDGEVIRSYFRSLDRNTGALTVSDISNSTATRKGIGTRTLLVFKKLSVDRLGRISEVPRELRTWRGKVCT